MNIKYKIGKDVPPTSKLIRTEQVKFKSCTISVDNLSLCVLAAFLNSSILMFPLASVPIDTIFIPHIAALAGFVPCAETGIMQTLRWWSPLAYSFSN